jgi:hypothetical protein
VIPNWGWPDRRGLFDVAAFANNVLQAGLSDTPAFLEIIYPFELADDAVSASITSSVLHCRQHYAGEPIDKRKTA